MTSDGNGAVPGPSGDGESEVPTTSEQATNQATNQASSSQLNNADLPALFWDEMPDEADLKGNADLAAINSIIDETTQYDRLLNFKDYGNRALKTGMEHRRKYYLRQAIDQYTQGVNVELDLGDDVGPDEDGKTVADLKRLKSILFSNRAHVHLLLGNNRSAFLDTKDALLYDQGNIKALYRAAKSTAALSLWKECRGYCERGLELDPDNQDIKNILNGLVAEEEKRRKAAAAEAARHFRLREPFARTVDVLESRGWKIGRPQFAIGNRKPSVVCGDGDAEHGNNEHDNEVIWPVLFLYPEANFLQDSILGFSELDAFADHLDVIFEKPPEWDTDGNYTPDAVEVYYLSNCARPLRRNELVEALFGGWPSVSSEGPDRLEAKWVKVNPKHTLGQVLSRSDYVVPGIPVFFVLTPNTPGRETFLKGELPIF
jgi:tetratricopeptide (TPR) repeat protein